MKPRRIQLSRKAGWRMPENTVKVDRSSKRFGNPFKVGGWFMVGDPDPSARFKFLWCQKIIWEPKDEQTAKAEGYTFIKDNEMAVQFYRRLVAANENLRREILTLRGKNIGCWCGHDEACHGNVILEIANVPQVHNPAGLTQKQLGKGYRFLDFDEIHERDLHIPVDCWMNGKWDGGGVPGKSWRGNSVRYTYRTKLSREELEALSI